MSIQCQKLTACSCNQNVLERQLDQQAKQYEGMVFIYYPNLSHKTAELLTTKLI